MPFIRSKAGLFILGMAACSIPWAAFADSGFHSARLSEAATPGALPMANRKMLLASPLPVSDVELADARGGFSAGGVNFNFGASVQTLVNGQLALQTNVQWTPAGALVTQLQGLGTAIQTQVASTLASAGINVPTPNSPAPATVSASPATQVAAPASAAASPLPPTTGMVPASSTTSLTGAGTSSPLAPSIGLTVPAPSSAQNLTANSLVTAVAVAPSNIGTPSPAPTTPSPASNASASASPSVVSPGVMSGVQIQSPTGSTAILANVTNGQIQNVILNSASNQNFVQNTNIVLTIYNFASWQQMLAQHAMSMQLANQLMAASGFTGGR